MKGYLAEEIRPLLAFLLAESAALAGAREPGRKEL